jgi:hypothetical protein
MLFTTASSFLLCNNLLCNQTAAITRSGMMNDINNGDEAVARGQAGVLVDFIFGRMMKFRRSRRWKRSNACCSDDEHAILRRT